MKRLLSAIFLTVASLVANSANWQDLGKNGDVNFFADTDSVIKSSLNGKPIIGIWSKMVFDKPSKERMFNGKYIASELTFYWVNCPEKTISTISEYVQYDAKNQTMNTYSEPMYKLQFRPFVPNSAHSEVYNSACFTAFTKDATALGDNPTEYELKKVMSEYPYQIEELKKYDEESNK